MRGLKTTYYLRTVGATHAEKATVASGQLNAVSNSTAGHVAGGAMVRGDVAVAVARSLEPATDVKFCAIDNPDCEACQ